MMFSVLSFFLNPTSVLAPIAALVLGLTLGAAGGFVTGYDVAVAKYQVASLTQQISDLAEASVEKERIIEEDAKSADLMEASRAALEAEIEKVLHAPHSRPGACRLNAEQLLQLRRLSAKIS
jgi:hypothetical protein